MAEYYVDENGNVKKKKKKEQTGSRYRVDESGKVTKISGGKSSNNDIAPTNYDHLTTQKEIESELDPLKERNSFWSSIKDEAKALFGVGDSSLKELRDQRLSDEANMSVLEQKLAATKKADREKEFIKKYGGISQNEDFTEKSAYKSTKNDKWWSGLTSQYGLRYDDLIYEYINNADLTRDEITRASGKFGEYSTEFRDKGYDRLTADETKVYNYLYATGGKEAADEYLEGLAETLNTRKATADFENVEGKTALEILGGVHVGLDQAKSGIKNLGNMIEGEDDYIAPTSAQILGGMMREDLADDTFPVWYNAKEKKWEDEILGASVGQFAYDAVTTTANMIPSVATATAIGVVNPAAGAVAGGALMGGSAAGNSYQWALSEGYDQDAARAYGTSIGVLEASLQAALGGIAKLGGTSKYISKAVAGIDNALLRVSLQYGGQIASESLEEGLQEVIDPLLQKAILGADAEVDWEEVAYSALLGGIMGGVMGGDSGGLTHNEQKVVNKVFETEIAQKEADGKTLTKKDKAKLYDSVVERMEKGQIDTSVLDEMFGGDEYTSFTDTLNKFGESDLYKAYEKGLAEEKTIADEIEALGKKEGATPADNFRYNELMQQQKDFAEKKSQIEAETKKLSEMRRSLTDNIMKRFGERDGRLAESYREEARHHQKFKADPKQYKGEHAQKTVQNILDSDLADNSNQTHEFVDWLAEMSEARGVAFTMTDAKRLAGTRYEYKGKTTNAFLNEETGTITLNINSKNPLNSTVGHELAHVLEGTEFYEDFKNNFKAWANKKSGEWDARIKATQELYAQRDEDGNIIYDENGDMVYIKKDVNIENEVMADLIGDYIFTDKDFMKHLSVEQPNAFKHFWDEVKFMIKCAKAGTEVEKELLHLEKQFAQIWRESGKYQTKATEAATQEVNETVENVNDSVDTVEEVTEQTDLAEVEAADEAVTEAPIAETVEETPAAEEAVAEEVKKPKRKRKLSNKAIERFAKKASNKYMRGSFVKNGKQYISDSTFAVELNTVDESIPHAYAFPYADVKDVLNGAEKNSIDGNYAIDIDEVISVAKAAKGEEYFYNAVKVGDGLFDIKKVEAVLRAIENPDISLSKFGKDLNYRMLRIVGTNGNAIVAPLRNDSKSKVVYEAQPIEESGKVQYSVSDSDAKSGIEYDKTSDSYSPVKYSISSWDKSDYVTERKKAAADMAKNLGVTEEQASKYIDDVNSIAKMIADDRERLAYEPSPNRSAFVSNAEYGGSIDFSTICKKRRLFTGTFEAIQNALPNTALTADEVLEIRKMMKDKGYEVSCGLCYVEGSRTNMGLFTKQFIERYAATNPEYVPNMAEMNTATGQEKIRKEHPEVYEAYEYFMNHYGRLFPTDKALFASQQKPKMYQMATEYKGEILEKFGGKNRSVEEKNKNGGLRLQSFSDFEIIHLIDSMQVIMDMSRVGLAGQAYTKVPDFAWALGDTGLKINLSLIAKDVDANGRLILDEVEGMKESDAMALRDRYSDNVGTIVVVFTDAQLKAAMADERIDYIIPYHRSQWKTSQYESMGLPENTQDYTPWQNESYIEDVFNKNGKKQRPSNYMPNAYWDFGKSGKENAEAYLAMCAENNRKPKFSNLLVDNGDGSYSLQPDGSTDGYWKTLIDFKMYNNDGVGVPQNPVVPNFNMEEAQRMLNEYTGGHSKFPVAKDIVEEFVSKHPDNIAPVQNSLSEEGEQPKSYGDFAVYGKDIAYTPDDIAPVGENVARNTVGEAADSVGNDVPFPDEIVPMTKDEANALQDEKVNAHSATSLEAIQTEIANLKELRSESYASLEQKIANKQAELKSKKNQDTKTANNLRMQIERLKRLRDSTDADYAKRISTLETREKLVREGKPTTQQEHHSNIITKIKETFKNIGLDFDEVLKKAKNLSTFSTVDNTPQRVMEKALGYKEGQALADLTVNKVAQNETEGIKWLNSFTERKNGLLAQISKQYRIKPGSKESAAAQMYAEGFYVNDNNEIIAYGDAELAQDFPNEGVQYRIKGLAADPRIRQIYDETLKAINESRTRNGYPAIQKLDNYFLHFRAMDDTFSKLGLPFNPNDIRAKDLPTDLNGVTADLKPGQPYFASAMHRMGKRTSFDLLGGLERYLTSAKNQIYHIDDIQTLRALRNYIADTYGQANGLEGIDALSEEEAQERIEKVYNSHLSTFAKFLNEEANVLAGKTALIDRGLEGIIGRRGITFLDTVNKQTGSNMVGYSASSALVNFDAIPRAFAKSNKFDFIKGFAQTVSNRLGSIVGKGDGFAENSPVIIRRKGAERFHRTPFQKASDGGYYLMGVVDDISTEIIARAKFNELTRKGMDEQTAHFETDKWVSKLMGDRSLGQQPLVFNSKMLGLVTKFQLEVRNNLDSQFYDTIQEAKASSEDIENALARNAKIAAKVTSTFVQLAVAQHWFGKAFESIAGYNPSFDIISVLATLFGWDDDEESEDTALDNLEQGFLELLEDLPYTSTLTGGRIPISSALPIAELIKGEDSYGNEKSRWETLAEVAPYYVLPGGYGQYKKTRAGLNMFSDEHPISGSYTDSGKLRFPVEDTPLNRVQAALFGQYASKNAREYFDNDYAPLSEKQTQEFIDVDIPIAEYRDYREGLKEQETLEDKFDYIAGLDLPVEKKNILINNVVDRKEPVDLEGYEDFGSLEEFDFATKNPEKYAFAKSVGGYSAYKTYSDALNDIHADKDASGKSINGSRKEKVINYINNLDVDYYTKIVLHKSEYPSDDTYNQEIVDYIVSRSDFTYEERVAILAELGFRVAADGQIYDAD